jgi:hypothetical protein
MLWLLPMNDQAKDAEILALRHQLTVLERQLHGEKVQFAQADRVFSSANQYPGPPLLVPVGSPHCRT